MIGLQISGYTITESIGAGGMSDVYKAKNNLGRIVAVKVLKKKFSDEEGVNKRFVHEAQVMYKLHDDDGIPDVYDIGYIDDRPAIVMEFLQGKSFKDLINQNISISDLDMQKYFRECARILSFAHNHPSHIIHRDIKPSNIYLSADGQIKIFDFGIAKTLENLTHTETGARLGTLLYMSPEQIDDPKRVDHKADIYSLGITFYHLITRKQLYDPNTETERTIMNRIVAEEIDLKQLTPVWQKVLGACLVKNAKYRYEIDDIVDLFDKKIVDIPIPPILDHKLNKDEYHDITIPDTNQGTKSERKPETKPEVTLKIEPDEIPKVNFRPFIVVGFILVFTIIVGYSVYDTFPKINNDNIEEATEEVTEEVTEVVDSTAASPDDMPSPAKEKNVNTSNSILEKSKYIIILGNYIDESNAKIALNKVQSKGFSNVTINNFDMSQYFTVSIRNIKSQEEANSISNLLKKKGIDNYVKTLQE